MLKVATTRHAVNMHVGIIPVLLHVLARTLLDHHNTTVASQTVMPAIIRVYRLKRTTAFK